MSNSTKFKFLPLPRFWPQKEAVLRLDQNFCFQSKPLYSRECPHKVWWFGTQYQEKIKHLFLCFRLTSAPCISFVIINNSASCYLTTFDGIFKAEIDKNPPKLGQKSYQKFSCIFHKYKVKQSKNSILVSNVPSY